MTDELRNSVERLRALSPKLNKTTDEANRTIQLVEQFLNEECMLGIPSSVSCDELCERTVNVWIAYDRIGPRFRLVVQEDTLKTDEDGSVIKDHFDDPVVVNSQSTPLSDSARGVKLKAMKYLPDLLKNLAIGAEDAISSAEGAISAVNEIVGAIGPVSKSPPKTAKLAMQMSPEAARIINSDPRIGSLDERKMIGPK